MTQRPNRPSLASVEADLCEAVFGFHKKAMTLLRDSALDEERLHVVAHRIKVLKERLEAAYDAVRRLVDQLSGIPDGREKG
jgi:hypothetical protein